MTYNTYKNVFNNKVTPQTEPIPDKDMVKNNAGGYAFQLDKFKQLERFLILGTTGGTYYVAQKPLTQENALVVKACIDEDPQKALDLILDVSDKGRAPSNDPALFALAVACTNPKSRKQALAILPKVARIGTHLFHFVQYLDGMRGWGRSIREGVAKWYTEKNTADLAFQMAKYQQRDGWAHGDVLRLAHVKPTSTEQNEMFAFAVGKSEKSPEYGLLGTMEKLKGATTEQEIVDIVSGQGGVMEIVPSQWKNKPAVQKALLPNLGLTALVRNLGNYGASGLLVQGNWDVLTDIVARLSDEKAIKKSRIHPMQALMAKLTYDNGHGVRGSNSWEVVPQISQALEDLIYKSFGNVEPTNKKYYIGLDVSGSMRYNYVAGSELLSCAQASGVMAMTLLRTEPLVVIKAFSEGVKELPLNKNMSMGDVFGRIRNINFGVTACALPMLDALKNNIYVDAFIVITDNETWAGNIHPVQALKQYQNQINKDAKLIVIGMTSTGFSIAEQGNPSMLDVVGFDTATPDVIAEFVR